MAISSVYLSITALMIGGFISMTLENFSTKPANPRIGPTGNENLGGLRPRAEHVRHPISYKSCLRP
jgi:hypothetical protein